MLKNWRTTLLGAITGLVMIIKGIITKEPLSIIEGVGIAVTGALASDVHLTEKNKTAISENENRIELLEERAEYVLPTYSKKK